MASAAIFIILLANCIFCIFCFRINPPTVVSEGEDTHLTSVVTTNDPRCKKNGIFPNLKDCTKYFVCRDGRSQDRQCPVDFKFDTYKHCTPDEDADCGKNQTHETIECPEAYGMFDFKSDCRRYIVCTLGKPKIHNCPENQVYQKYVGCIDGDVCPPSAPANSLCKIQNGLFPIPGKCQKYIKCVNGEPKEKECPQGQGFDRKRKQCIPLQNARCRSNDIHEILMN